ncbi:hypothetical protein O6H91_02G033900 [Diphasiastrum complanatum]|uniref:Uncharacterized protein n=1 Tax=Diphasiastrum complanatum TaxID=34168 RepID=A0ACC2EEL7_DIPCM|nr:hypothetical protein O6H91_02G033900 [Diphasiastrum complanatum]
MRRLLQLRQVTDSLHGVDDLSTAELQTSISESWWNKADESEVWQDWVYYSLAAAYALVAIAALVQLIRIQLRVPEYGWTTQKVFHFLNFLVSGVRAITFLFRHELQSLPEVFRSILLDLPGILFFSTYALLVLFWAEIYNQARNLPTDKFRPVFLTLNAAVYVIQILIWLIEIWKPSNTLETGSKLFFAGVFFVTAIAFLLHGGRLYFMLRRFPIESRGRQKKLREVGLVTSICFICFTIRSFMIAFSTIDKKADLDILDHPLLNVIYYVVVEIIPSALILFILRKLPPRRISPVYTTIN